MADVPPGVKGMNDILPPEVSKWQFLEQHARDVLDSFAYRELRTPVLEYTPLFVRSVGEVTLSLSGGERGAAGWAPRQCR
jgi:histidyl-tRNA synthetase